MTTTVYPITDSNIRQAGLFADGKGGTSGATPAGYRVFIGNQSRFEIKFTGASGVTARICAAATQPVLRAIIDGGSPVTLTLGSAGVETDVSLCSGLSTSDNHTIALEHYSGTALNAGINISSAFALTGPNPTLLTPDGYGEQYDALGFPLASVARYQGPVKESTDNGYANCLWLYGPDASIRFNASPTDIKCWMLQNGNTYRVYVDGSPLFASRAAANTGRYGWETAATGLDGAEHEVEIVGTNPSTTALLKIQTVMLIGGTLGASTPVDKFQLLCIGDSKTAGYNTDSTQAYGSIVARATNRTVVNCGLISSRVAKAVQTVACFGQRYGDFISPFYCNHVDEIILHYGHNDGVNQATLADFYGEYRRMCELLLAAFPSANVHACGLLPTTASMTPLTISQYSGQVAQVVTDVGNARLTYHSTLTTDFSPTFNATAGQDTSDGVHPNPSGHTKIANRLLTVISTAGTP